jgi:probable F420-dependent oxidoreductase
MKYSLGLPVDHVEPPSEFVSAAAIAEMSQAAEAAGFHAVHVTEHPFPTQVGPHMGGHFAFDPIVCMTHVAATTKTLKLHFNAFVLSYRNPFMGAKQLADLDTISGGRVIAGVAAGYMAGELAALGAKVEERAQLLDENLAAMIAAWSGEPVHMESPRGAWVANGNRLAPRPPQRPHPPIWIGGNSRAAIKRVARFGQGWMPFPAKPNESGAVRTAAMTSLKDLRARIGILKEEMAAAGRTDTFDICMTPFCHQHHPRGNEPYDPPALKEEVAQLTEMGVTWISLAARAPDRKTFLKNIERYNKDFISA